MLLTDGFIAFGRNLPVEMPSSEEVHYIGCATEWEFCSEQTARNLIYISPSHRARLVWL